MENIEKWINIFNDKHNNRYDYSQVVYKNNITNVKIICIDHGIFNQSPKNHSHGHGCPKCALILKSKNQSKSISDFISQCEIIHKCAYSYFKTEYTNNKNKVIVTCKSHGDFRITPSHHINGHGCSKCSGNYNKSNSEYILICKNKHNNRYDYSLVDYKNSKSKISIICKKHGIFKQIANHHISGHGCPSCYISNGENIIKSYLELKKINFTKEKTFYNCRSDKGFNLRFDFYLPDKNLCIEYDGIHHFKPIKHFGGEERLKKIKHNDSLKDKFCMENNINIIRISYNQNIIKKLTNEID